MYKPPQKTTLSLYNVDKDNKDGKSNDEKNTIDKNIDKENFSAAQDVSSGIQGMVSSIHDEENEIWDIHIGRGTALLSHFS